MKSIYFTSQRNYLKQDDSSGNTIMNGPNTSAYSGTLFIRNLVINHSLGFVPAFKVYYEPFLDGVIWPPLSTRLAGEATNPINTAQTSIGLIAWADSTNLTLQLYYSNNTLATNQYPVYWNIYVDYQL